MRSNTFRFSMLLFVIPWLCIFNVIVFSEGFVLPTTYQNPNNEPYSSSSWPYDGGDSSSIENGEPNEHEGGWGEFLKSNQINPNFEELFLDPVILTMNNNGIRIPRSCDPYRMKNLLQRACSDNYKRSARDTPDSNSTTSRDKRNSQGVPVIMNLIVVEYYIPSQTSSSSQSSSSSSFLPLLQPSFSQNEPASSHLNGGATASGAGWISQPVANLGSGTSSSNPNGDDVAVVIQQNMAFPVHLHPAIVASFSPRVVEHQRNSEGHGGSTTGIILIVERANSNEASGGTQQQTSFPADSSLFLLHDQHRELLRRSLAKRDQLQKITKKCCNDECSEEDFYPLC